MTGNLNAKWSDFPAALTVGAQVLLIDADPLSLSELARVLAPVVDLAITSAADSAMESIEAGALVARAARRRLALRRHEALLRHRWSHASGSCASREGPPRGTSRFRQICSDARGIARCGQPL